MWGQPGDFMTASTDFAASSASAAPQRQAGALIVGHGPHKVIALHGWFGSADGWGPFVDSLNREAFTFAFMDYRGYGSRLAEAGSYTMAEISADALALADALGWAEFSLIGHSMGGMAIQRVLADAPQRVRKLVGITPVAASGVPFDEAGWAWFSSAAANPEVRRGIIDFTTGSRLTGVWLDAMVRHSLATSTPESFAEHLVAWAKTDFAAEIAGRHSLPVLALPGANDPALGEAATRATWALHYPQAQIEVIANAGHYPMFETPVDLATRIERFLAA
jgi:pimeloyl-ACP methyl ester carboxylesterase